MSFNLLMHHLCLGFTCIALFLYPSCSFAVISLIVFTHNMHTLCYIGYSTWSKNWLINFMCELWKIFLLRDMIDNQCANIFSTHVIVYGSHNGKFAFIERENIFLHVYPQLSFFFKLGLCLFLYPHSLYFSPKLFFPKLVLFFLFL